MSDVVLTKSGAIATLTLNNPERRNAMTTKMVETFPSLLADIAGDNAIRVAIITGAGKDFCSGADFSMIPNLSQKLGGGADAASNAARLIYDTFLGLLDLPQPTIAAVNGAAVGGGLGIALACEIRVVANEAKLGANFSRLGIHPGMGISRILPAIIGPEAAAELLLTGELIDGAQAVRLGLARYAVPREQVLAQAQAVAQRIAAAAPLATRAIKQTLAAERKRLVTDVLDREAALQAQLSQSADAREGVMAMMQKREPDFKGK